MTHYTFSANIRDFANDNTRSIVAFIFLFFVLEVAFVERWWDAHPWSFTLVHAGLIIISTFCFIYHFKLRAIDGDYSIILTDKSLTARSPHPMIGDSFKIELEKLKKLVFLYTVSYREGVRVKNQTGRVFFIDTGNEKLILPEFPGHNCEKLFEIIKAVSPETSLFTREVQLKESLALSKRLFKNLHIL